jgi:hypothetical protein
MIELSLLKSPNPSEDITGLAVDNQGNNSESSAPSSFKSKALKFLLLSSCVASASFLALSSNTKAGTSSPHVNVTEEEKKSSLITEFHKDAHFHPKTLQPLKFHQSGFGALNYHHNEDGSGAFSRYLSSTEVHVPVSAVPHAIQSIDEPHIINLYGHYVHDEHHSPYSSPKYSRTAAELKQEQHEYIAKMAKVREDWGAWNFKDHSDQARPQQDFSSVQYKDVPASGWTDGVWQKDKAYIKDFIKEGRSLVDRMENAILAELGHHASKPYGQELSAEEIADRKKLMQLCITEDIGETVCPEGHFMKLSRSAFQGLVRKLLHSMITNDEFYFILGGHSAAAGHGNDHSQQKTMQFHNIMEPVFHRLGMRLISKNLAMGGLGTLHFSMGQSTLYGEKDFLLWDSMMTEKISGDIDLFNKQAILGGERVPLVVSPFHYNLMEETGDTAWLGSEHVPKNILPPTRGEEQAVTLPWLTQAQYCPEGEVDICNGRTMLNKYDAVCWVERNDVTPVRHATMVNARPKGQASWHPGWRSHRIQSRYHAKLFLEALKSAFNIWEEGIAASDSTLPLTDSSWHVKDVYQNIQNKLRDHINGEEKETSECEKRFSAVKLEKICRTKMTGMGEFRPINLSHKNGLVAHMKGSNPHPGKVWGTKLYDGPDLLPLSWKIPEEDVDVHAIAIATNYQPGNHMNWHHTGDDEEDAENQRRSLRQSNDKQASILTRALDADLDPRIQGLWEHDVMATDEFCDGSINSECNRIESQNACLMHGMNDKRNGLSGSGETGWLVLNIPNVQEGIIYAKMEWWHPRNWSPREPPRNLGSTQEVDQQSEERNLKAAPQPFPDDFFFDIAVNGQIHDTWDKEKFMEYAKEIAYNQAFYPLVDDEKFKGAGDVELSIRFRSEKDPTNAACTITHLYYA